MPEPRRPVNSPGAEFLRRTRYEQLEPSAQSLGERQPPLQLPPEPGRPLVPLPAAATLDQAPPGLREAIEARRSRRSFSSDPLSLEELSWLLWCAQGVQQVLPGQAATLRTVPSAGARHALETYLSVHRVRSLEPGLYRFCALEHALQRLPSPAGPGALGRGPGHALAEACLGQGFVERSAVSFVFTAAVERMLWRYGQRGYRYLFLDAGHACQNLYLACEAIGCGACAIAAFDDAQVDRLLGLDGERQFTLYLAAAGRRPAGGR